MRVLLVLVALLIAPVVARAQQGSGAGQPSSVSGRVELPHANTTIPVPGLFVTLHRVGTDSSGPVDSVRTDAGGNYTIRYRRALGDEAVYFAAAVYRGIAYFSTPIQGARVSGDEGAITVFDTTSKPVELHVRGHHVVVSAPRPDGARDLVEVWELSNDTTVTVVGKDTLAPVWSTSLPRGATNVRAGQGDVSPDAIQARGNRILMLAPFGPGVKQVSYSYSLPSSAFPLDIAIDKPTTVLEVLLEEPLAQVAGSTLRATDAATTGGRTFKRFLGQDASAGESVRISVPVTSAATRTSVLAILAGSIALIMVGTLARTLMRRGTRLQLPIAQPVHQTNALVAEIAALDARHERNDPMLDDDAYATDRAALKAKLTQALAAGDRVV
ncbi:MAG: hypothetical protein ABI664_12760 [bacterium]